MTSQGSASGRFKRAVKQRNLFGAEAMRELGTPSLIDALDYLDLLAEVKPEKLEQAARAPPRSCRVGHVNSILWLTRRVRGRRADTE
jgi:hypothetical protein